MTLPSFFKTSYDLVLHQESLNLYLQQISEKKTHLTNAQSAYNESLQLVDGFKHKISLVKEQIAEIDRVLDTTEDNLALQKFKLQKQHYEEFIENANKKLEPFVQRLNQLSQDIQTLEQEIKDIEEQVDGLTIPEIVP